MFQTLKTKRSDKKHLNSVYICLNITPNHVKKETNMQKTYNYQNHHSFKQSILPNQPQLRASIMLQQKHYRTKRKTYTHNLMHTQKKQKQNAKIKRVPTTNKQTKKQTN